MFVKFVIIYDTGSALIRHLCWRDNLVCLCFDLKMAEFFLHILVYFCLHLFITNSVKLNDLPPSFYWMYIVFAFTWSVNLPNILEEASSKTVTLQKKDGRNKLWFRYAEKKPEKKPRVRNDKRKSLRKKTRKGFCGKAFIRSTGNNELSTTSMTTTTPEEENHDVYSVPVMGKKIGEPLKTTPVKMLTRKRKRVSTLLSSNDICPADGYKIIDSSIFQNVLCTVSKCTSCGIEKTLQLKHNQKKRGMCETLMLYCSS